MANNPKIYACAWLLGWGGSLVELGNSNLMPHMSGLLGTKALSILRHKTSSMQLYFSLDLLGDQFTRNLLYKESWNSLGKILDKS